MANTTNLSFTRLRNTLRYSSAALQIVWLNIAFFVILRLAGAVCVISGNDRWLTDIMQWSVEVPSSPALLLTRPWTLLTYMFAQYDVWHALFNLLCFYWFAIVLLNIAGSRRLWHLYIFGGLCGALAYLIGSNALPGYAGTTHWLIGGSGAVLAVVTATAMICPGFRLMMFFFGEVKIKWIALVIILLSLAGGLTGDNLVSNLAHIGGIASGVAYAIAYRRGINLTHRISRQITRLTSALRPRKRATTDAPRATFNAPYDQPRASADDVKSLDIILDKIKKSGYATLTPEERRILFEVSSRIK